MSLRFISKVYLRLIVHDEGVKLQGSEIRFRVRVYDLALMVQSAGEGAGHMVLGAGFRL